MSTMAARHVRSYGLYFHINLSSCATAVGRVASVQSLTPTQEDMRGSGGTAPQLDKRHISYKLQAMDTFLLEKKQPIPIAQDAGWTPKPFSTLWWTEISLPLPANQHAEHPPPPSSYFRHVRAPRGTYWNRCQDIHNIWEFYEKLSTYLSCL